METKLIVSTKAGGSDCYIDLHPENIGEQRILDLFALRITKEGFREPHELLLDATFQGHVSHNRVNHIRILFNTKNDPRLSTPQPPPNGHGGRGFPCPARRRLEGFE